MCLTEVKMKLYSLDLCILLKDLTHYQGNTPVPADLLPHRTSAEGKALLPTNETKAVVAVGCKTLLLLNAKNEYFSAATNKRGQRNMDRYCRFVISCFLSSACRGKFFTIL